MSRRSKAGGSTRSVAPVRLKAKAAHLAARRRSALVATCTPRQHAPKRTQDGAWVVPPRAAARARGGRAVSLKSPSLSSGRACVRGGAVLLQSNSWSTPPGRRAASAEGASQTAPYTCAPGGPRRPAGAAHQHALPPGTAEHWPQRCPRQHDCPPHRPAVPGVWRARPVCLDTPCTWTGLQAVSMTRCKNTGQAAEMHPSCQAAQDVPRWAPPAPLHTEEAPHKLPTRHSSACRRRRMPRRPHPAGLRQGPAAPRRARGRARTVRVG